MPTRVVNIDTTADIAARRVDTLTDAAVIGTADGEPEDAEFGEVNRYTEAEQVSDDYGEDTDVHVASEAIENMGAAHWYVLVLEETHVEAEEVTSGEEVENTPILGDAGVEATIDTEEADVVYSADSPPDEPDEGEVAINTDTGEVTVGGEGTAELEYAYIDDWDGLNELPMHDINVIGRADVQADLRHIGEYDELADFADENMMGLVAAYIDARDVEDVYEAMEIAHEFGAYVSSGDFLTTSHKSTADVGSYILGQLAANDEWHNPLWDRHEGEGYPFEADSFRQDIVGDPGSSDTLEGGDEDGQGPTNAVINVNGNTILSNSLTTAGDDSDYQYFPVGRAQAFGARQVDLALTDLRLDSNQIPFTGDGKTMIRDGIRGALSPFTGDLGDPFADFDVEVPHPDDLSQEDRANQRWTGIEFEAELPGDGHEFELEFNVTV